MMMNGSAILILCKVYTVKFAYKTLTFVEVYNYTLFPHIIPWQPLVVVIVSTVPAEDGVKVQGNDHPVASSDFNSIETEICSVFPWLCYHTKYGDGGLRVTTSTSDITCGHHHTY